LSGSHVNSPIQSGPESSKRRSNATNQLASWAWQSVLPPESTASTAVTPREREVLGLTAEGRSNSATAKALWSPSAYRRST
jgi:DNA-binding NarL/FixJ family response regulator